MCLFARGDTFDFGGVFFWIKLSKQEMEWQEAGERSDDCIFWFRSEAGVFFINWIFQYLSVFSRKCFFTHSWTFTFTTGVRGCLKIKQWVKLFIVFVWLGWKIWTRLCVYRWIGFYLSWNNGPITSVSLIFSSKNRKLLMFAHFLYEKYWISDRNGGDVENELEWRVIFESLALGWIS